MKTPPIVSPQEWEAARQQLLVKEKELTRARDALAAQRRRMPWMAVEKEYAFEGPNGPASLLDLFEGRRQLIVYRFFFDPGVADWPQGGCRGCSMMADQLAHLAHLNARDTTLAYVSRAPQPDIERWKARMGWEVPWYTLTDSFDADFGVDEWHGTNAFLREGDRVFRTYFIDSRGDEALGSVWSYLDMTALGRQEEWEDSPEGYPQTEPYRWWRLHDEYGVDDRIVWNGRNEEVRPTIDEHPPQQEVAGVPSDVPAERPAALDRLNVLVGTWEMEASFEAGYFGAGSPPVSGRGGRTTFEWLEGGFFLLQRFTVFSPGAPNGIAIIGMGPDPETFEQHYYDSRGVARVYRTSLDGGVWKLWREAPGFWQRYAGRLSQDGRTITGSWEWSADGSSWKHDFDLAYIRTE